MNADIKGALSRFNKVWHLFEHKGKQMSKSQVKAVLGYALKKGYETTAQLTDKEVDEVLLTIK